MVGLDALHRRHRACAAATYPIRTASIEINAQGRRDAVSSVLDDADLDLHGRAGSRRPDNESIRERIMVIRPAIPGSPSTMSTVQRSRRQVDGSASTLERSTGDMAINAAHDIATRLGAEHPPTNSARDVEVDTHIEPLETGICRSAPDGPRLNRVEAIQGPQLGALRRPFGRDP